MPTLTCKICQNDWDRPTRRGRVPQACPDCTERVLHRRVHPATEEREKPLVGKAKTEHLEALLRSSGKHISQHRKDNE